MYAADRLLSDAAYMATHLHWGLGEILGLEHRDREFLLEQISSWYPEPDGVIS